MSFTERTSLPTLQAGEVVVQTSAKESLDAIRFLAPVLSSSYPALTQTTAPSTSSDSTEVSEGEDDMECEDLNNYTFATMQRCPSLTASQDSLSPSPTPSPTTASFFGSEAASDAVTKTEKPSTYGTVLVVGVGFVGAHLMERFSSAYEVVAFDVSENRCQYLRKAHCKNPNVTFISDLDADERTKSFDLCLVSVPTLLTADLSQVDQTHIRSAFNMVSRIARPGSTVVVESSVTVGMTRELFSPLLAQGVHVGFSPERVDPGRTFPAFEDIPKVVSGLDQSSLERITELYSRVFNKVVPVSKPEVAEFTKLYENCQRLVNIAYVNEIADACTKHGVDVHEVVMASSTKPFGFMPYTPSLGAGGHCIPVNPFYLFANCDLPLLRSAAFANQQRPVAKAVEVAKIAAENHAAQNKVGKVSIAIVGMGFKRGEASLAYAPTVTLADKLTELDVEVSYVDDFVTSDKWAKIPSTTFQDAAKFDSLFDAVVVAQKPIASELAVLEKLTSAKVVYFTK
ncbi:related to UDP-N-acetyl-D-mannosamine 6-dehydrogenase [Melanopsichium pennsylvanicum]|uniref:Related to UDP-N-acetyl-D-mannosamine 6-dehydrogenase n=2 Tax=Melanopsichium pennsylvanicum TaxID=63383 RepID=A0AAJ4XSV6_9BASI|nr:related to udp-n-acetyl-d-mannosamine 6-dehydrogenase [Melanopsichium pennsylvanicum 4]SNX87753.1 related to UDP-N-acetyl-D-mannosamine 6-dehydrogenase [Melanopsichium pennsylvanicum]